MASLIEDVEGEKVLGESKPVEAWESARSAPTSAKVWVQSLPFLTFRFVIVKLILTFSTEYVEELDLRNLPDKQMIWGQRALKVENLGTKDPK